MGNLPCTKVTPRNLRGRVAGQSSASHAVVLVESRRCAVAMFTSNRSIGDRNFERIEFFVIVITACAK
jgi:hypothetical protein